MYCRTSNRIKFDEGISDPFISERGAKQGDVLSPIFFNIFINQIIDILDNHSTDPISIDNSKLHCLLYADDLVLLSSSPAGLQNSLDLLAKFCSDWKLEINLTKSKAMIFNSNGKTFLDFFKINGSYIETIDKYCYLGIVLKYNGNFNLASNVLQDKARKALFKVKKTLGFNISCKTLEKVFDSMVLPILLYVSELWGIESATNFSKASSFMYEKFHIKFIKEILGKTTNSACLSELNRLPIGSKIIMYSIKFLNHIISSRNSLVNELFFNTLESNSWTKNMKKCLQKLGFSHLMCFNTDFKPLFPQLKQRINDIFLQEQNASIHSSEKLLFFKSFCLSPERAYYVDHLENFINRSVVSKFRLSAHNLEIERGRHCNITREDRL